MASLIILSVMLVAVLNTVAAARSGERLIAERQRGLLLAQALMGEILQQAYADPGYGLGSFGIGSDEVVGNRSLYDDVDDYHGWTASPPQNKDGSVIPGTSGYEQSVAVAWVTANNLDQTSGSETQIKRIIVTIKYQGRVVASLRAYRTAVWTDPVALQGAYP